MSQPEYVFLARAALSPLARNSQCLWIPCSPPSAWLRLVSRTHGLGLYAPTMIPDGTLLAAQSMDTTVHVARQRTFIPTCRLVDERLADFAVWRGFELRDENNDRTTLRHTLTDLADSDMGVLSIRARD